MANGGQWKIFRDFVILFLPISFPLSRFEFARLVVALDRLQVAPLQINLHTVDGLTEDERKPMLKIFHALLPSQTISRPCPADYAALAANARQSLASHDNLTHICPPRPARPTTAQDFLFSTSRGEHYPVSTTPGITIASTRPELPGN